MSFFIFDVFFIPVKEYEMDLNSEIKRFRNRLSKEGVIKSVLLGCGFALALSAVVAAVCWYFGFNALFIALPVFVISGAGLSVLLFFKKYRPTLKSVAARVDELGLEERLITMTELIGNDSYIAMRQREDTFETVKKVNENLLPVAVSATLVVCFSLAFIFGTGATTASALAAYGVIPSGKEAIEELNKKPPVFYVAKYKAAENGKLVCPDFTPNSVDIENNGYSMSDDGVITFKGDGSVEVKIAEGVAGAYVFAIPAKGYVFAGWSDGVETPFRSDLGSANIGTVTANFAEGDFDIEAFLKDLANGYGKDSDSPNKPFDLGGGESGGSSSGGEGGGTGGGWGTANNVVIDGQTDYSDVYKDYSSSELDRINNDPSIPDSVKKAINEYFNAIKTKNNSDGE